MSMRNRLLSLALFILAFICIAICVFWPISFSKELFEEDYLAVTYVDSMDDSEEPVKDFNFDSNSPEFKQLKQIFKEYSYHKCLDTWKNNPSIEFGEEPFIISNGSDKIIISTAPSIVINDKVYRVGYLGTSKIKDLHSELKKMLNLE
jgi:hypothetical protein